MRRARALPARAGAEARATPAQRRCLLPCEAPESAATTRPPPLCEAARRPAASTPRPEERPSICPVTQPHGAAPPPRRRPGPCKAPEDVAPTRPRPLCEPLPRRVAPTPRPGERPSIGPVARPHGAAPPPPRCPGLCEAPEDVAPTRLPPLREASPRPVALPSRPGERSHIGPVARPHGAAPPPRRCPGLCEAPEDVATTRPPSLCEALPLPVAPTPRPGERSHISPVARPHGAAPPPPRRTASCDAAATRRQAARGRAVGRAAPSRSDIEKTQRGLLRRRPRCSGVMDGSRKRNAGGERLPRTLSRRRPRGCRCSR